MCELKIIVDFLWAAMYGGCLPDLLLKVKGHHVCFCFHVQIYALCCPNGTHPEVRVYTVCIYIIIYIYIINDTYIYIGLIKAYQPGYSGVNCLASLGPAGLPSVI